MFCGLDFIACYTFQHQLVTWVSRRRRERDTAGSSFLVSSPTLYQTLLTHSNSSSIVHFSLPVAISNVYCILSCLENTNLLLKKHFGMLMYVHFK